MSANVTPTRPYLLRGFYEWMLDNELTPHLVVNANLPGVQVPTQFVEDGQIVLNLAPHAVGNLQLGNDVVQFNARFGGKPHALSVPLAAIDAIYARENGAGTAFAPEEAYDIIEEEEVEPAPPPRPSGRPSLKVIK
ncbi:ClpXP protease specificity-enhancing factor [uncultured Ferrimonas sp.]|uniref:ClpXP protease specificity-enhancing factor n=1 Tax=uncultured Ferrimonas sp. TaxID=432640 RepID=UPI0026220D51|nr:ClpXP protease specificity-enhancing factor [uncultured Ferrimonas sp.]